MMEIMQMKGCEQMETMVLDFEEEMKSWKEQMGDQVGVGDERDSLISCLVKQIEKGSQASKLDEGMDEV